MKSNRPEKIDFNINYYMTFYPNEKGWIRMVDLIRKSYYLKSEDEAKKIIERNKTSDGGYRDQMWCIISDLSEMFYMGTDLLENTKTILEYDD